GRPARFCRLPGRGQHAGALHGAPSHGTAGGAFPPLPAARAHRGQSRWVSLPHGAQHRGDAASCGPRAAAAKVGGGGAGGPPAGYGRPDGTGPRPVPGARGIRLTWEKPCINIEFGRGAPQASQLRSGRSAILMNRTYMAKPGSVQRKWYVIDAKGKTLGRLASQVAAVLRGKHKPQYTPHVDTGDFVIVVNADKVRLTGKKWDEKMYYFQRSHRPGGLRAFTARQLHQRDATRLVKLAVWGMLPHNRLGRKLFSKLKVYAGPDHPHAAQQPEEFPLPVG